MKRSETILEKQSTVIVLPEFFEIMKKAKIEMKIDCD